MGKIAFLFAGQGAQAPGMGKDLFEHSHAARIAFLEAEALRPGTQDDCFAADAARLAQTDVTQPCVFTVDYAAAAALAEGGVQPDGVAGFSLGEMAALTFAGAFSFESGFNLVCRRAELMQAAAGDAPGAMAAVMRLPDETVEALCAGFDELWPVNYNCEGQLVVAGNAAVMEAFCAKVKEAGGTAKMLAVGGAFHTPYMQGAAAAFLPEIRGAGMRKPQLPVYANLTAKPYATPGEDTLAAQMQSPVRWRATIQQMAADGYDTFVEVGPGKTLTGLCKRIVPQARLFTVNGVEGLRGLLAEGNQMHESM